MYAYIKGLLIQATPSQVIIETQGVGFLVSIPFNNFSKLPALGQPLLLHTAHVVREDSQRLYGFLTEQEKHLFEELIDVSGVGPKTALILIGHMQVYDLQAAIQQGHTHLLCKIPGIGKKTAERLIVELRDKILQKKSSAASPSFDKKGGSTLDDATSALINLGYHPIQIQKALTRVMAKTDKEPELATLITAILRVI